MMKDSKPDNNTTARYCATCLHWSGYPVTSVSWGAPQVCNTSSRETCSSWTGKETVSGK